MRCVLSLVVVLFSWVSLHGTAIADIYKFTKSDGTVVYTDNLSAVPKARRAHYARRARERAEALEALKQALGEEEFERRRAEEKKARLLAEKKRDDEVERQLLEVEARLGALLARRQAAEQEEAQWRDRARQARTSLKEKLQAFNEKQQAVQSLAIRPRHTLYPAQRQALDAGRAALKGLEREVDEAIDVLEIQLPREARKARVPPGWLR